MTVEAIVKHISLDTQVFVATGFNFGSKVFEALKKHIATGRLGLVMTDVTVMEVKSRIKQNVAAELLRQREFINESRVLHNSNLPQVKNALEKLDTDKVAQELCDQFDAFLAEMKAEIIEAMHLSASNVFKKYFAVQPPFGEAEKKKREFPDAFAIQALSEWAENTRQSTFVVSKDKLFRSACDKYTHLITKETLKEVLDHIASDDEQLALFVRAETMKRIDEIKAQAKADFEDRDYYVEDEDGEAEVRVMKLTPVSEPGIIEIAQHQATLLLSITAGYTADLSYNDSGTASYDKGELMYVARREEQVSRERDLTVQIEVLFEQMDPDSFKIIDISVIEPDAGFGIETESHHNYARQ
jgi:hypothetical protein